MAGYIRQDTTNNIADGNVINASDFDNEYNAIEAAFHATTGHTHDGTSAEGAPITKIGPTQDVVASATALTPKTDNTIDLGSSTLEYKDLWIDGTANIDSLVADTADINAGTIDGVTIGGASAGAGTFTTVAATTGNITTVNATTVDTTNIEVTNVKAKDGTSAATIADSTGVVSFTANPILSGGTANGVTYLNGSKVLTSGSALTFDGTNVGATGAIAVGNQAATGTSGTLRFISSGGISYIQSGQNQTAGSFAPLAFTEMFGSGELMRLTSTGLGIGTSSPGAKLDVNGNINVASTSRIGYIAQTDTSTVAGVTVPNYGIGFGSFTGFGGPGMGAFGYYGLLFSTAGLERMRLDSSGNLGLGVTPSAWSASFKAIQLSTQTALWSSGANTFLSSNVYNDGTNKYIGTGHSTRYYQSTGAHNWETAPSGTAGNAISFTQAMTLDASGNLLVGTTTVGSALTDGFSLQQGGGASQIHIGHTSGIGSGELYAGFSRGGTTIGSISQNGTTAVLFNTTSDRRLKDNIVPAPSASDDIDAIQIVSHDWKSAPDEQVKYGVIAQDLHAVAPQAVLQGDDGDEIEKTWGVDYSKLVPMLIKEVQSLRARVAALEA